MIESASSSPWLTAEEARQYIKSGVKIVYREVAAGRLRAARIGGRRDLRFRKEWLDEWLERTAAPVVVR
jgi:excisionase family DNA binding protein